MAVTLIENVILSKRISEIISVNPTTLGFIEEKTGCAAINEKLMNAPMVGDLSLYDALIQSYVNDELEFCELCSVGDEVSESRVVLRGGRLEGEHVIDAMKFEIYIRENLRVYAPAFAGGFANLIISNLDVLEAVKLLEVDAPVEEKVKVIDGLMAESLESESIACILLDHDEGKERAEAMLDYFREMGELK